MPNPLNIANNGCFWQYLCLSSIQDHSLSMHPSKGRLSLTREHVAWFATNRSVCNAYQTESLVPIAHLFSLHRYWKALRSSPCRSVLWDGSQVVMWPITCTHGWTLRAAACPHHQTWWSSIALEEDNRTSSNMATHTCGSRVLRRRWV